VPETPKHSVSVTGVVVNDAGQVLVIQRRDNGQWQSPGGVLELGETFEEGLRREILEETGVPVEIEQLTGVYKNMQLGVVALVFRCRPLAERARVTDEARSVRLASPSAIPSLMGPAFAVRVDDALSATTAVTRAHDGVRVIDR